MPADLTVGTLVEHPNYGEGIIARVHLTSYDIFFERGGKVQFSKSNDDLEVLERPENSGGPSIDLKAFKDVLEFSLDQRGMLQEEVALGDKWIGGTLSLEPSDEGLKPKEISIESFFHKIVMLRDRLRVLEQNINSHKKLDDEDKVHLQQYITRIYGSLTTFNVLFKDKDDYFKGTGGK